MTPVVDSLPPTPSAAPAETDLLPALARVFQESSEPLTLSRIRALLPGRFRGIDLDELAEQLRRQVAANVLWQFPKYRSPQDRFWDRPMSVHLVALVRAALEEKPLALAELRRKLPAYARAQAEAVLQEQVSQGLLHRHPRPGTRGPERFSARPADPKDYLRSELSTLFGRLERLGFNQVQLREGALELLHDEEWSPASSGEEPVRDPDAATAPASSPTAAPRAEQATAGPEASVPSAQS